MKTCAFILLLFLITSVCGAHDDWLSGSTDRQHLSGADLNNYLHGHKETVDGTVKTGFWDYDPDVDDHWEKIQTNWKASGCVTEDANGKKLYNHDCYNDWIRDGNLKPTEKEKPDNPVIPPPCTDCDTPIQTEGEDLTDLTDDNADDTGTIDGASLGATGARLFPASSIDPLLVTEWMLIDTGRSYPHWIEIYNPNSVDVNIEGYTFTYAEYNLRTKWTHAPITLTDFQVPAKSAIILASHDTPIFSGLTTESIYQLNLNKHVLKRGWLLQDADGTEIHRIGRAFQNEGHPILANPPLVNTGAKGHTKGRVSYKRYKSSEPAQGEYYYGNATDVSSPGYFEVAPVAPALKKATLVSTWAALKRQ